MTPALFHNYPEMDVSVQCEQSIRKGNILEYFQATCSQVQYIQCWLGTDLAPVKGLATPTKHHGHMCGAIACGEVSKQLPGQTIHTGSPVCMVLPMNQDLGSSENLSISQISPE